MYVVSMYVGTDLNCLQLFLEYTYNYMYLGTTIDQLTIVHGALIYIFG